MKISKIVETCIYSSDLAGMKRFYVDVLGLQLVQEENGKFIFLKAGKSMLLVFNPDRTSRSNDNLPTHGAATPPASVHFAMEIEKQDYTRWQDLLAKNKIKAEEVGWKSARSLYFRDPAGNLVELITPGEWPVES
jgi:catechol-2,3-dioxygenase